MARENTVQPHPRELRQLWFEIDRLPAGIQVAVFTKIEIDTIQVQIKPQRVQPIFPVHQSATARADIQQVCVPRQRFEKLKAGVSLPKQFEKGVVGTFQPTLDRFELGDQTVQVAEHCAPPRSSAAETREPAKAYPGWSRPSNRRS